MKQAHRLVLTVACGVLCVSGAPFIDITTTPRNVSYDVTALPIAGTNNVEAVGTMWWTNLQSGVRGTLAAMPSWTISGIGLRWGPNTIVVYGTNAWGTLASDRVQVFRYNRDGSGQQSGSKYGLRSQGTLAGWGYSDFGQTDCPASNDYVAITAGRIHSLALRNDGTLVAWGNNYAGQTNCPAGTNYLAVAAGSDHSLALRNDGTIAGWGRGDYGQTNCPAGSDYVAVAAGEWHSVALRNDGTLVAWGDNTYGQTNCPAGNDYVAVAALGWHSLALRSDGTLTGWGLGAYGETICPAGSNYVAIATGNSHSLALRSDGTLVGWGLGNWGQTNCPAGTNYVAVAAGSYHSLALRNDGRLVAWGDNSYGQTNCPAGFCTAIAAGGNHNLALYIAPFIDITNVDVTAVMHDITSATIGGTNGPETDITNTVVGAMWWTNALTSARGSFAKAQSWTIGGIVLAVGTNTIAVYGSNIMGNVSADSVSIIRGPVGTGMPFVDITNAPATVTYNITSYAVAGTNNVEVVGTLWWTNLQSGAHGTLAAPSWTIGGIGLRWGPNTIVVYGTNALGTLAADSVSVFRYNCDGSGQQSGSTFGLRPQGTLVGWGDNAYGETNCPPGNSYAAMTVGRYHAVALRSGTTLVGWGDNTYGQTNCPAGSNYLAVAAGWYHTLAVRSDGTLVAWGMNNWGQTNCPAGSNYMAVAAGGFHSLAVRNNGTLVGWGSNGSSETNCPPGSTYVALAGGWTHSLALRNNGTIVAWGGNSNGQTNCPAGSNYVAVAAGANHSVALRSDGTLVAWGLNIHGETNCPAGSNYVAVAAGLYHSLALRDDGRVVAWGQGTYGETNCPAGAYVAIAAGGYHGLALWQSVPFIDITNADMTAVTYDTTSYSVAGTNNANVVGGMSVSNATSGGVSTGFAAAPSWTAPMIALGVGANTIIVHGTNIYGTATNDGVTVTRGGIGTGAPFIDITTTPHTVAYLLSAAVVAGTNNMQIAGSLWWTNDRHPADTYMLVLGFSAAVGNLEHGDNLITVAGTNLSGRMTADVVTIHRQTYAEAAPQIATNALLFPTADSQLTAFTQTNIVWDPARITDAEDGTNLLLTLISVLDAGTTDTVAVVATNISSLLGHAPWTAPLPPEGQTSYVVRFAVMDSTALTNSRVFWNNVFKVVPEPAVLLLTLALAWTMCHVRSAVEKRGGK
ncbi:MAG: hypothetical protein NTV22_07525 [bacterium]|nr:hypothetical protein [bacterium]